MSNVKSGESNLNPSEDLDDIYEGMAEAMKFRAGQISGYDLLRAAEMGNARLVQEILDAPVEERGLILLRLIATDEQGNTPLHLAAKGGHASVVELLLQHGISPTTRNKHNATAAQVAKAAGFSDLASQLEAATNKSSNQ